MLDVDEQRIHDVRVEVGDALRIVATYDRTAYEYHYIRDDVTERYTDEEFEEALDQFEIEGMGYRHFERFFDVGRMECAIYGFEEALIFQFPHDEFTGLVLSIDRDVELNPESVISACTAGLPPQRE